MKSKIAIAAASALMLIAAPTAYADSTSDGVSPDTPDYFGCDYAAGECDIVVEPTTDRCVDTQSSTEAGSFWLYKGSQWHLVRWNWGADSEADAQLRQSASELSALIAAGDSVGAREICDWDSAPTPDSGGDGNSFDSDPPIENAYPTLPSECEPTADRTAIECTYDYGDRIDVQPAFGCWTLDDGSEICVDPPEIPNFVGCDYAAGECDIVVDPTTDRCVIAAYGPEIDPSIWLFRDGNLHIIEWNWGADPAADDALKQSWNEIVQLIAAGDVDGLTARCWPNAPGDGDPVDEPTPVDPIPVPYPGPDGRFEEGEISFDSPAALSGARAEKGKKQKKAKKKSRGKKSKPKKSSRR